MMRNKKRKKYKECQFNNYCFNNSFEVCYNCKIKICEDHVTTCDFCDELVYCINCIKFCKKDNCKREICRYHSVEYSKKPKDYYCFYINVKEKKIQIADNRNSERQST